MSRGVLLFAQNNNTIDYIKQAIFCAKKIKKHLNLPVALATDNPKYVSDTYSYYSKYIDHIIELEWYYCNQKRTYYDGTMSTRDLEWRNHNRFLVYDITPFDETIVMDTDFIIGNNILLNCFDSGEDFLIYRNIQDINHDRPDEHRFNKIADRSIDMYWATVFYFKKTEMTQLFFNLVSHIKDNWNFYRLMYQIPSAMYRNDFSFSIAIHILNGFQRTSWPKPLPGKLWFSSDRDVLIKLDDEVYTFLVDKKDWVGHYTLAKIGNVNLHVMNKFSLDRKITEVLENE